ncbi:MAG: hypothetical protein NVSMB7_11150 [Chitinophagaceae bacterium]
MKRTTTFNNLGGLQSLLFCAGIYAVSLFFSIFICSAVFYAFNPKKENTAQNITLVNTTPEKGMFASVGK